MEPGQNHWVLGVLTVGFVALGGLLGTTYLDLFGALAIALNFGAYYYSDRIVLRVHQAREVDRRSAPGLVAMVEELSRNAQIPAPRVYILPDAQPNAFATGRNPEHGAVAVTEGILSLLSERELRGGIAHELAHIKNRDILIASVAATIASAVTYIANAFQWAAIFGFGGEDEDSPSPIAGLALAFLAPIGATLIQLGISRSREFEADATGARISGDPEGLARALEKLRIGTERIPTQVEPATASLFIPSPFSGGGAMSNLFSTHPDMGERIARLRAMDTRAPVRRAG